MFFYNFRTDFYRLLDPLIAQICCVYHALLMVFMFRKSHHFGWLLTSQNEAKTSKMSDFWAIIMIRFYVFSLCAFFRKRCFVSTRASLLRGQLFAGCYENSWFLVFFQVSDFRGLQSSLFEVLVGSEDLQNRPWPSKTINFLKEKHGFHKIMIFHQKHEVLKKHDFS